MFVAVTARYRQGREFKHVAPFNVYTLPDNILYKKIRSKRNLRVSKLSSTRTLSQSAYNRPLILLIRFMKVHCTDSILLTAPRYGNQMLEAYSNIGRTYVVNALFNVAGSLEMKHSCINQI